jgi:hypothetical protein
VLARGSVSRSMSENKGCLGYLSARYRACGLRVTDPRSGGWLAWLLRVIDPRSEGLRINGLCGLIDA